MKASLSWLGDFVELKDLTPREVADKLTMAGLEVEDLYDRFTHLNKVVSARLDKVIPLSSSDYLKNCTVSAGPFGRFTVICGAPNAREGLTVPLALSGTILPGGRKVEIINISGHQSEGLLCSEAELGLGLDASGLLELQNPVGLTLKEITSREDWTMEIGITPNRPDGLSIIGLARDLAAILNRPLRLVDNQLLETGPKVNSLAQVIIDDPEHCSRFTARVITDVKIGPSPSWMVERLASVGLRSINNIIDVTNYVMLEIGQPIHAYDLEALTDHRLIARSYPRGTHFTTLDGQELTLTAKVNLMICDGEKPVSLAGIMGGLNSKIKDHTQQVLLESAAFSATTIRRTSRANGISTDASYRFERGSDPEICGWAVDRAAALIRELTGGTIAQGRLDQYPRPFKPRRVNFSPKRCNAYLGTNYNRSDMLRVLSAIGLTLATDEGEIITTALPPWRPDLSREVDLWEEVARLLNFDQLPATLPKPPTKRLAPPPIWQFQAKVREILTAQGLSESITYSFINQNFADKLGLPKNSLWRQRILPILNPLSEEQGIMRPLLAPSLLAALKTNQSSGHDFTALFELGRVFLANGLNCQPEERETLAGLLNGANGQGTWIEPKRPVDFWDIKGLVETLTETLNIPVIFKRSVDLPPWYDPAEAAIIDWPGSGRLGHLGRLGQGATKAFGLKDAAGPTYLFELDAEIILTKALKVRPFQNWSKFPPADRDLAVLVPRDTLASDLVAAMHIDTTLPLVRVLIFDLYQGDQIPPNRKSLAFRLTFQAPDKTLTDEDVTGYFDRITSRLARDFGASLRS
ncbi:MAG: phenylalanine--tRNA ligase subunit beta [Candidatus Adiutrix intracellularis]|jgi:phenylalanyl-tRNA synthetase beta chain|nr:phenylalanine--tRNA ligase subunit beta [Candidatus Adiutrix intracellularis]